MNRAPTSFVCHGCGAVVDIARAFPFACPNAGKGGDIDHLLVAPDCGEFVPGNEPNPFVRYRALLSPYRLARTEGLSDDDWEEIVGRLDRALSVVDGVGCRTTPMARAPRLAEAAGLGCDLWIKDETGNVAGSHKARHLIGMMLYLRVLEAARLPRGDGLRARRLAIASCGNAALAAAVIARAAEWPIDVFIPPDAPDAVVRRLKDLGAAISVCERQGGETGDPCFKAFRRAVQSGAIPFGVQGTENGLAVEGGRTLAFEMAETFGAHGVSPAAVFVQVGGGALASAMAQGLSIAAAQGIISHRIRLIAVQTAGCAPLARAWEQMAGVEMEQAVRHRSRFMWPWEQTPVSVAHGILDDETYDWWEIVKAMRATKGTPVIADEDALTRAHALGRTYTDMRASATGTAGLAGLLTMKDLMGPVAVVFSGAER